MMTRLRTLAVILWAVASSDANPMVYRVSALLMMTRCCTLLMNAANSASGGVMVGANSASALSIMTRAWTVPRSGSSVVLLRSVYVYVLSADVTMTPAVA